MWVLHCPSLTTAVSCWVEVSCWIEAHPANPVHVPGVAGVPSSGCKGDIEMIADTLIGSLAHE